jgi:hypothetical protein
VIRIYINNTHGIKQWKYVSQICLQLAGDNVVCVVVEGGGHHVVGHGKRDGSLGCLAWDVS